MYFIYLKLKLLESGMKKKTTGLQNRLAVSQKSKRKLPTGPRNSNPWYIPKGNENKSPYKNSYTNVHSSNIHNSQKVKIIQMSILCIYSSIKMNE